MSNGILWGLILVGALASLGLVRLIRRQWAAAQARAAATRAREAQHAAARAALVDSLRILSLGIEQDQIELSEACLRIKGLLDRLAPQWLQEAELSVFQRMHDALAHMPTHEARQQTDKRFTFKLDQQRFRLEAEYRDALREAARALRERLERL